MDAFVKGFIKGSVTWLTLGVTLGVAMALRPAWITYRAAHLHMLTLGFVAMMIFGVGYHVIPRMVGHPLASGRLPLWHWWFSNVGLALIAAGFIVRVHAGTLGATMLGIGAVLSALGAYTFAYLIWRTVDGPDTLRRIARRVHEGRGEQLPVLQIIAKSPAAPAAPSSSAKKASHKTLRADRKARPGDVRDAR